MARIEILDDNGDVENVILADPEFAEAQFPGRWRVVEVPPEVPEPPIWLWYIDIGPFFDRFGPAKMAVLTSADPGVKAILSDTQIRKWVALNATEVAQSIDYIRSKVPAVTQALRDAILFTPVKPEENLALRKLYFSSGG